jgi:hypothetical protein
MWKMESIYISSKSFNCAKKIKSFLQIKKKSNLILNVEHQKLSRCKSEWRLEQETREQPIGYMLKEWVHFSYPPRSLLSFAKDLLYNSNSLENMDRFESWSLYSMGDSPFRKEDIN